jgi:site-specific recombinase XerD
VRRVLAVVPKTPLGLRDRAVILMLRMTGRRRAEVLRLRAADVEPEGSQVYYRYRGKGGRREPPPPVARAIARQLTVRATSMAELPADRPLWPAEGLRMD